MTIPIEAKLVPVRIGDDVADAGDVAIDTTNFGTNLNSNVDDVQKLAEAVSNQAQAPGAPASVSSVIRFVDNAGAPLPLIDAATQASFDASLTGETILAGYAYRFNTTTFPTGPVTYLLGTFEEDDILVATINDPSLTDPGQWVTIRPGTALPVTATESHFLDTASESDNRVDLIDASSTGESSFVRFWLRVVTVTQGNLENPGTGLQIAEAEDDVFTMTVDQPTSRLYVSFQDTYVATTEQRRLIDIVTVDANGEEADRYNLEDDFENANLNRAGGGETFFVTTGANAGESIRYLANQTIRAWRIEINRHFELTATPTVDVTQNIDGLSETALSLEVQAKLNAGTISGTEQRILDLWMTETTETAPALLPDLTPIWVKYGAPSADIDDYREINLDIGIFGKFTGPSQVIALLRDNITVTGWNATISGTVTFEEIVPSLIPEYRMWRLQIPTETDLNNVYEPIGTIAEFADFKLGPDGKIGRDNFTPELAGDFDAIYRPHLSDAMEEFQSDLTVSHSSDPSLVWPAIATPEPYAAPLSREVAFAWDENRTGSTPFTGNYFNDVDPDPVFGQTNTHWYYFANADDEANMLFPGRQSFFTGSLQVSGGNLQDVLKKVVLFDYHVNSASISGTKNALQIGSERVLEIRQDGLYIRIGNLDGTAAASTYDRRLTQFANYQGRSQLFLQGIGVTNAAWFVPDVNPAGDNLAFPLTLTFRMRLVTGGQTGAETLVSFVISDRATPVNMNDVTVAMNVPGGGTQDEVFDIAYSEVTHNVTIASDGLSQNGTANVDQIGIEVTFNDTEQINASNTAAEYELARHIEHDNLITVAIMFFEHDPQETSADKMVGFKVIVNGALILTNVVGSRFPLESLNFRDSALDFADITIGDASIEDIAFSGVQVYTYTGATPPTEANVRRMWQLRDRWLGLFRHYTLGYPTFTVDGDIEARDTQGNTRGLVFNADLAANASLQALNAQTTANNAIAVTNLFPTGLVGNANDGLVVNAQEDSYVLQTNPAGHPAIVGLDARKMVRVNTTADGYDYSHYAVDTTVLSQNNEVLTLPNSYIDFEFLWLGVVDAGQIISGLVSVRSLQINQALNFILVGGATTCAWNRTTRQLTLGTGVTWFQATLLLARAY